MLYELQHVQEAMAQLEKNSGDPYTLPAASEQVLYCEVFIFNCHLIILSFITYLINFNPNANYNY